MSNRSYLSVWCRGFSESSLPELLVKFLGTVPFSSSQPGITELVVRAVDPAETPLIERDLRPRPYDPGEVLAELAEILHADSSIEVEAHWDLWAYDLEKGGWRLGPERLEILCFGEEYDDGAYKESGHFQVDLGFEHLFTGHADLLGRNGVPAGKPEHPVETEFLRRMAQPVMLREYREKTRDNVSRLQNWVKRISQDLPVERFLLWSEGEENFEERLDEILAAD